MARWTEWRKIAEGDDWFDDKCDHKGSSCYELGLKSLTGRKIVTVYVGHTKNEYNRIRDYARAGSHLWKLIDRVLDEGFVLFYRAQAKSTKLKAKKMEEKLLEENYYAWNKQLN